MRQQRPPSPRVRVDIHNADTQTWTSHRWTFARLLAALEQAHRRPPAFTVCLGDSGRCIAITTDPGGRYAGHHGVAGPTGQFQGAMTYRDLAIADVRRVLIAFYAGCPAARCFNGRHGEFIEDERPVLHASQPV